MGDCGRRLDRAGRMAGACRVPRPGNLVPHRDRLRGEGRTGASSSSLQSAPGSVLSGVRRSKRVSCPMGRSSRQEPWSRLSRWLDPTKAAIPFEQESSSTCVKVIRLQATTQSCCSNCLRDSWSRMETCSRSMPGNSAHQMPGHPGMRATSRAGVWLPGLKSRTSL